MKLIMMKWPHQTVATRRGWGAGEGVGVEGT